MEKKKMKLWKKILIGVLIVIAIFLIFVTRRFIIITNLDNISKEYANKTNYIEIVSYAQGSNAYIRTLYNKNGNILSEMKIIGKISNQPNIYTTTFTSYINGNDKISIVQRGEEKKVEDGFEVGNNLVKCAYNYWKYDNLIYHLINAITSRITTTEYNNKKCYRIETNGIILWIDKDTGLICREINGFGVAEFNYEFDVVKDDDIVKPSV